MKTFDGYSKEKFSDTSVLLAGGGSKELSNFIGTLNWDSTNRKLLYKKIGDTNWRDLVTFGSNATNSTAYLPLAGGNMKGNIGYTGSNGTYTMIRFIDNKNNALGYGLCLGGGGTTIVGSGESLNSFANNLTDANDEVLYLLSDNHIQFGTGYDSVKWTYLDKDRNFYPGTNNAGSLGISSNYWNSAYIKNLNVSDGTETSYLKVRGSYPNIRGNGTGLFFSIGDNWGDGNCNICLESNLIRPAGSNNNKIAIGNSNYKFASVTATTFYGSLSGNATTASGLSLQSKDLSSSPGTWVSSGSSIIVSGNDYIVFLASSGNDTFLLTADANTLYFRQNDSTNIPSSGWNSWVACLNSGNYSSYALPLSGGTCTGDIYAPHFYESSDIRYKKILRNLSITSNTIANLPLFDFEWIENNSIGTGTSAQAVQEILPNLVSGTDKLTLDYGVLGTIAGITACKELVNLKSEIDLLKERIKELEQQLKIINNN